MPKQYTPFPEKMGTRIRPLMRSSGDRDCSASKKPGGHFHYIDGGGDVPLDRVWFSGHHHWHRISKSAWLATGGLLRLSQGCFPAGFPAHNVYVRPAISAPVTVRVGRNRFLWMYDDTQQNRESVCTSTNESWINARSRNSLPLSLPLTGYAYESFLARYIVTGWIFCAPSGLRQGQAFTPPPPQRHVPATVNMEVPSGVMSQNIWGGGGGTIFARVWEGGVPPPTVGSF